MSKFTSHSLFSRRKTLILGLGSLTTFATLLGGSLKDKTYQTKASHHQDRNFKTLDNTPLKDRALAKGLIYGAFPQADYIKFVQDAKFKSSFLQECGLLVTGLYWSQIRPSVNSYNFANSDYFANSASANNMLLRGHPLVWHKALPHWVKETLNLKNAEKIFINHIKTVTKRYAGQMHSWDVINEAIEPKDGRSDGLRKTPWLEFLGSDYLDLAFRVASEIDPNALLVYNDYGLEYDTRNAEAHRTAVLKLLERLKSKGTPIHALGIQSHLYANQFRFNPKKLRNFMSDVASLGLKILITELDVSDKKLPSNLVLRDRIIAGVYEDYLSTVLDERAVIAVITWGLSDRYSWLNEFEPRSDNAPVRPLPFDAQMRRKLAWNAIARAFDNAPKR